MSYDNIHLHKFMANGNYRWIQNVISIMALLLTICIFLVAFQCVHCVLPPYLPLLQNQQLHRDVVIEEYFWLDLEYLEIVLSLFLFHGIQLSLRQLMRILARKNLTRGQYQSSPLDIVSAIEQELKKTNGHGLLGYRQMHQRLRLDYNIVTNNSFNNSFNNSNISSTCKLLSCLNDAIEADYNIINWPFYDITDCSLFFNLLCRWFFTSSLKRLLFWNQGMVPWMKMT